jgi:ribonuclease HII
MSKLTVKAVEESLINLDIHAALERLKILKTEGAMHLDKLVEKYTKRKQACDKEKARFDVMCIYEREAIENGYEYTAGIDEAGRGPLAGPVVAAAVILPEDIFIEGLNDSKQLSAKQRERIFEEIRQKAISIGVGIVDEKCIDAINILNATKKAMLDAISQLTPQPDILLIDAVALEETEIKQVPIIKGDCKSISIAAASIIAKVTRDRMIDEMDTSYPEYGFTRHKGYGTEEHIQAIKKFGICPIHRVSFTKNFTG